MRRTAFLFAFALTLAAGDMHAGPAAVPVIVELFTSEGCSDCPPADTLLEKLIAQQPVDGAQIIGLGQHVDYWDRQGWKDRFSSAAVTHRQELYQARFSTESIYTPQMVVDGRLEFIGSNSAAALKAIEHTLTAPHGTIRLTLDEDVAKGKAAHIGVSVAASDLPHAARGDRADIIVAVTESGLSTDVKRGENHGKVLRHAAVVRYIATIGQVPADGTAASARADIALAGEWQRDHLTAVAFVQETKGRTILASASAALKNAHP